MKKFYSHLLLTCLAAFTSLSMYAQTCSTVTLDPLDIQTVSGTTYTCDGQMLTINFTGDAAATGYRIRVGNNGAPNAFTNLDVKYLQETGAGSYSVDIAIPNGSNGSQYTAIVDFTTDAFVAPFAALNYSDCFSANQQTFNVAIDPTAPTGITLTGDADKNDAISDVCINTDFSLTVAGGINGDLGVVQWSVDNFATAPIATGNTFDVNGGITANTIYYVRRVDVLCGVTTMTAMLNVTVNGIYVYDFDLSYDAIDDGNNGLLDATLLNGNQTLCHFNGSNEIFINNENLSGVPVNDVIADRIEKRVADVAFGAPTSVSYTSGNTLIENLTFQADEDKNIFYRIRLQGADICAYQDVAGTYPSSDTITTYDVVENDIIPQTSIEFQIDGGMWTPYTVATNICAGDVRFRYNVNAASALSSNVGGVTSLNLGNNPNLNLFFQVNVNGSGLVDEAGDVLGNFNATTQFLISNSYTITEGQTISAKLNYSDACQLLGVIPNNNGVATADFTAFPGAAVNDAAFTAQNVTKAVAVLDGGSVCENDNVTFTIDVDGGIATPLVIGGASGTISVYSKSLTAANYTGAPIASNMTVTDLTTMNQVIVSDTSFLAVIENSCGDSVVIGEININTVLNPTQPTSLTIVDSDMNTLTMMDNGLCAGENIMLTAVDGALGTNGTARYRFYGVVDPDGANTETELAGSNTVNSTITVAHNIIYDAYRVRISAGAPCPIMSIPGTGVEFRVTDFTNNVAPISLTPSATTTCGNEMVTFTIDAGAMLSTKPGAMYQFAGNMSFAMGTIIATQTANAITITVDRDTTVYARIIDGCNDVSTTVVNSGTIDWQKQSVAPTMVNSDAAMNIACGATMVEFTPANFVVGDMATIEYQVRDAMSNIITSWTAAADQMTGAQTINVTEDITVEYRIVGGCNDVTPATTMVVAPSVSIDFQIASTPLTSVTASPLNPGNSVCDVTLVTFTANGGIIGDGAVVEFSGDAMFTSILQSDAVDRDIQISVDRDTTIYARISGGCTGGTTVRSIAVDYREPSDVSSVLVEYTDVTDPMNPVAIDPNTLTLCPGTDVKVDISNYTLGQGAVLRYRLNAGPPIINIIGNTFTLTNVLDLTQLQIFITGSCNGSPILVDGLTFNVYPEIPDVTSLTIDKDNVCANSGEVVRLKTFTSAPVGNPPYSYDWSTFNPTTGIYTPISGVDMTADTLDVTPTVTTTYAVRIIGCNEVSPYVAQLVTVKDTSDVTGATIISSVDANGSKVCAGNQVTFNLQGGLRGFNAELKWFSNANGTPVQIGLGNPFTMNVTADTTVFARYEGECNTSVFTSTKSIEVFEQSDVTMSVPSVNVNQCVGTMADLTALTIQTPVGGNFSGANVSGNVLNVQTGENIFTYTFNFGACSFSVNDTIIGITAPVAQLVAGSIVPNACSPTSPVGAFDVEDVNNEGLTITVTGGNFPGGVSMTTTPTDSIVTFSGLTASAYVVTATNSTSCTSTFTVVITSAAGLSAKVDTAASSLIVCNGSSTGAIKVVGTGGVAPYEYSFINNADNYSADNDTTGLDGTEVFDIKVRDANGCVFNVGDNIQLLQNVNVSKLTLNNIVEPTCFANADGRFDAVASGGTGPYQYSLDGGPFQTSSRFDSLTVGVYTVTVLNTVSFAGMNVPGCPRNFVSPLLGPDSISAVVDITGGDPINGYDVTITATGGRGGFELSLNGGAFDTQFSFTALDSGDYVFTVRDINGCTKDGMFTLLGATGINNVDDVISSVYPNPFNNTLTLVGKNIVDAEVIFTDINGKQIAVEKSVDGNNVVLSTADVAKGVYLVRVISNNQSTVKRIVKQ